MKKNFFYLILKMTFNINFTELDVEDIIEFAELLLDSSFQIDETSNYKNGLLVHVLLNMNTNDFEFIGGFSKEEIEKALIFFKNIEDSEEYEEDNVDRYLEILNELNEYDI